MRKYQILEELQKLLGERETDLILELIDIMIGDEEERHRAYYHE